MTIKEINNLRRKIRREEEKLDLIKKLASLDDELKVYLINKIILIDNNNILFAIDELLEDVIFLQD